MNIGLDFDGVIADCAELKSRVARNIYKVSIPVEEFNKESVINKGLLTRETYKTLQQIIYETSEVGLLMRPVAGMRESVLRLISSGHRLRIITAREKRGLAVAKEWSKNHALNLDFVGVGHGVSKAEACTGLDAYIDDGLDVLEPLVDIVPHRFLFSWPYNSHLDEGSIAQRVSSWEKFCEAIDGLS